MKKTWLSLSLVLLLALGACAPSALPTAPPNGQGASTPVFIQEPTQTTDPAELTAEAPTPEPTEAPTTTPVSPNDIPFSAPLPPEPQGVLFQAADGQGLSGTYYPAAANPAPVVVLMHWIRGGQSDWDEVARWLQNRGIGPSARRGENPSLDPSWFPALPPETSYAVFTFNFRGCDKGCNPLDFAGWRKDAEAALAKAATLPGVDPSRVIAIGASIGGDGAVDGCADFLGSGLPGRCLGALSLSPGGYLELAYADAVKAVVEAPLPGTVWCAAALNDPDSNKACKSAAGATYNAIEYPGSSHGMDLFSPKIEPAVPVLILDFLSQANPQP